MTDDRMLARIAALLRQAEGTDNPHEAEAFMTAAQRLATATSIDLAVARAHSATRTAAQEPSMRTITIGEPGSRGLRTYVQLFAGIAAANDTEYGLAAYIYTQSLDRALRVAESIQAGMVGVNRGVISDPAAPFGGVKESGFGREGGLEGIEEYLDIKYIALTK